MQQKFRAVVIDDMDFCRDLLTDFLEDRGYQVLSLADATSCPLFPPRDINCPKQSACADFLLTDNRMPHMQGLDFLDLQATSECHLKTHCKAIFSANWTQEELDKAAQLGCKIFHKPYDLAALESWLDEQEKLIPKDRVLTDLCETMVKDHLK